jgi:hypothetical protein
MELVRLTFVYPLKRDRGTEFDLGRLCLISRSFLEGHSNSNNNNVWSCSISRLAMVHPSPGLQDQGLLRQIECMRRSYHEKLRKGRLI